MKLRDRILSLLFPKRCPFCNRGFRKQNAAAKAARKNCPLQQERSVPAAESLPASAGKKASCPVFSRLFSTKAPLPGRSFG